MYLTPIIVKHKFYKYLELHFILIHQWKDILIDIMTCLSILTN